MRLVVSTRLPGEDVVSIGFGGNLLYVNTSMYWLAGLELDLLSGFGKVTVPVLAAVHPHPVEWRRLLFLSSFVQEKAPGPGMQLPPYLGVLPLAVASAGEGVAERGLDARLFLWADLLERETLYRIIVAGVESGLGELVLVYVYNSPPVFGDFEIGGSPAAYYFLKRHFPRMAGRVGLGLGEASLRFEGHMGNYKRYWRRRHIDLLELAFKNQAQLARDVLQDVLENGGSVALKSLLDFTGEDKDYKDVFHRLLDYGYLRLAGIPPQVVVTEKGLYALRK